MPEDLIHLTATDRQLMDLSTGTPRYPSLAKLSPAHPLPPLLHVGRLHDRSFWAAPASPVDPLPEHPGLAWVETRSLLSELEHAAVHALSAARQLLWWERQHRFCGCCGQALQDSTTERARACPACKAVYYPAQAPAVIVAVTRGDRLLLAHNKNFRSGLHSLLAGFVDPGETLEQTVVREVFEEAGILVNTPTYVTSQPWPFPNSLMLGFTAEYLSGEIRTDGHEITDAAWYTRDALPEIPRPGTVARLLIDRWLAETKPL